MRILLIEDDLELAKQVTQMLHNAQYVIDVAHDGVEGLYVGNSEYYDAVILDLGLPKLDGLKVLTQWRQAGREMPVLILTARQTWREKVTGLQAGADDYLAKPFAMEELLARVEALIRRASGHPNPIFKCGEISIDTNLGRVTLADKPIDLTALEFRTLDYLMQHNHRVISKTELTAHIYGQDFDRDSNVIEVLINRLRKKLDPTYIKTRRGLGYQMAEPKNNA